MEQQKLFSTFSKFVVLNIMGMLGLSCYILADTYFVSNGLGTNGLAALNLAISIYSVIHATGIMIGIGGATNFTIFKAQNDDRADDIFTHSIAFGLLIGILFAFCGIFGSEVLSRMLGANEETFTMTNTYLKTILCFSPFFILNNVLIAFVRNDNEPRLAMCGMLVGSLSNVVLDYIFIFPLKMGMFGAAFATGLAPIISITLLSFHFIRKRNGFYLQKCKASVMLFGKIVSLGISSFVTEISSGIVLITFNIVILSLAGNTGVAAYGIVANLSLVAVGIFVGIAQGVQPLVSRSHGHNEERQLKQLLKYAVVLSVIIAAFIYIGVNYFSGTIISLFNSENNHDLASLAARGLLIYFVGFIFAGVNIVCISFLSACQKPQQAFVLSLVRGLLTIIPLVLILPGLWGVDGVWLVFPCAEIITTIILSRFIYQHFVHRNR